MKRLAIVLIIACWAGATALILTPLFLEWQTASEQQVEKAARESEMRAEWKALQAKGTSSATSLEADEAKNDQRLALAAVNNAKQEIISVGLWLVVLPIGALAILRIRKWALKDPHQRS
jgi:long-subunit acyl-CoA synthetase (AMP-forming)